jgi:hypothetical protein
MVIVPQKVEKLTALYATRKFLGVYKGPLPAILIQQKPVHALLPCRNVKQPKFPPPLFPHMLTV